MKGELIKKGDKFTAEVVDLTSKGLGVVKIDRNEGAYPFFVAGTCPGDVVECLTLKVGKSFGYAKILNILKPSKNRVNPICKLAEKCGGCSLQHISYDAQLKWKEGFVKDSFMRLGGVCPDTYNFQKIIPSEYKGKLKDVRYRNKAQYPVGESKDGKTRLVTGFYAIYSHNIVACSDCIIQKETDRSILDVIKKTAKENGIAAYDEGRQKGLLRHIMIRTAGKNEPSEIMVCLIINKTKAEYEKNTNLKTAFHNIQKEIVAVCKNSLECPVNVLINFNTRRDNVILGDEEVLLSGRPYIEDTIGDLKYKVSLKSFFQVNPYQTEKLYKKALELADIKSTDILWDLYCGTGTISTFAARRAKEVYGIEVVSDAVKMARENAALNNIKNVYFKEGKAEDIEIIERFKRPDIVILDPARKGCAKSLIDFICKIAPQKVVYISCNVSTQARDIKEFTAGGYKVREVCPVDMFPHTANVETVCLLSNRKSKPDSYIEVPLDMEDYYKIKDHGKDWKKFKNKDESGSDGQDKTASRD